jgi:hypothetical protein
MSFLLDGSGAAAPCATAESIIAAGSSSTAGARRTIPTGTVGKLVENRRTVRGEARHACVPAGLSAKAAAGAAEAG